MKRYGILLAVFMAFVLAITLTSGCSTPKKATKEDVTKSGTKPGLSDEELAKQRADQEARDRALREQALRDQEARERARRQPMRRASRTSRGSISISTVRSSAAKPGRSWARWPLSSRQARRRPSRSKATVTTAAPTSTTSPSASTGRTAAARYLQTLGIDRKRIKTISYGEERPVCSEATEACWHKNRNATFVYPIESSSPWEVSP